MLFKGYRDLTSKCQCTASPAGLTPFKRVEQWMLQEEQKTSYLGTKVKWQTYRTTAYNQHFWDTLHQTSESVYNARNQKVELLEPQRRTNEEYIHCTEIKVCVPEENLEICNLYARPQICIKRPLASSCLSVRLEQLGFHWKYFREI